MEHYLFPVYDWNNKYFTSADNLYEAFLKQLIDVERTETTYGAYYVFTTKQGLFIAKIYKDDTFGFSSQAYGVETPSPYEMFPEYRTYLDKKWNERNYKKL